MHARKGLFNSILCHTSQREATHKEGGERKDEVTVLKGREAGAGKGLGTKLSVTENSIQREGNRPHMMRLVRVLEH